MKLLAGIRSGVDRLRTRLKAVPAALQGVDGRHRGWLSIFSSGNFGDDGDLKTGDWQKDIKIDRNAVLANWAVFACMTLIAGDVGKVNLGLSEMKNGIEVQAYSPAFSPVLKKPNPFQTRQQFIESWITSKLSHGNTYVLKVRDNRGVVVRLYVLDPCLVTPLVAPNGAVYYRLGEDILSEIPFDDVTDAVPASEIIHDRMNCLFHPLVGLSPIFASGLAAMQGLKIQQNSAKFFQNMSRPSGVLTAPAAISDETAARLKREWEANYAGDKVGRVAVLGDALKYEAMTVNAVDAQLTEQLKLSAEMICSTFHVPAFKIGAGTIPAGQKVEDLNQIYYSDCLHALMDAIQTLLGEGLGLDTPKEGSVYVVRFDLDDLLKMDGATFIQSIANAIKASVMSPNEGRRKLNLPPVPGGDAPLSQQQNYSLEALARRDAGADPFGTAKPPAPAPAPAAPTPDPDAADEAAKAFMVELMAAIEALEVEHD
jgi:HK97 family phage portal protein